MKVTNIKWDTDGDMEILAELPSEVEIPENFVYKNSLEENEDEEALLDDVSDWLSDEYGFCHDGFSIKK